MTQEEKSLLLQDLCARLPYNMFVEKDGRKCAAITITSDGEIEIERGIGYYRYYDVQDVRPYLRPMSSMTEEEMKELKADTCPEGTGYFDEKYLICPVSHWGEHISYDFMSVILEWLYSHHFDYKGLIEKGLALEAPEDMYK